MHCVLLVVLLFVIDAAVSAPQTLKWESLTKSNSVSLVEKIPKFGTGAIEDVLDEMWNLFKSFHGKSYEDNAELKRKTTFAENVKSIQLHNYLYEKGLKSFKLGINQYTDMSSTEFVSTMNGLRPLNRTLGDAVTYLSPLSSINVPDKLDWRDKGYVTPVKNQGHCGSCWSFSATGSLEGQHFRKTQKLVSLSEQNLVDCSKKWGNNGCNGGLMDNAFQYINDNDGLDTEESYPYTAKEGKCKFTSQSIGATDVGFTDVTPAGNESKLKEALASVGPISIAIDASHPSFQQYESGIYDEAECSSSQLDHGVLLVGYDTDEQGNDYWIVKNSWGEGWGMKGYIHMVRNKSNQCGVASMASYPLV